jgi:hypothetical protein
MLFSRKWVAKLGASIQMDLSYATIPTSDGTFVTLCRHLALRHQVEYHKIPLNKLVWEYQDFGDLGFITNSIVSMEGEGHYGNKAFKDIKEPIILAFVPINLDYFQDFVIFPFSSKDTIDDVFPPKNKDDNKSYSLVQPKIQEYDINPTKIIKGEA